MAILLMSFIFCSLLKIKYSLVLNLFFSCFTINLFNQENEGVSTKENTDEQYLVSVPLLEGTDFVGAAVFYMDNDTVFNTGLIDFSLEMFGLIKMYFDFNHSTLIEPVIPTFDHSLVISSSANLDGFSKTCYVYYVEHVFYQTVTNERLGITFGPTATVIGIDFQLMCSNDGVYAPSSVNFSSGGGSSPSTSTTTTSRDRRTNEPLDESALRDAWLKCSSWNFVERSGAGRSAFTVLDNAYVEMYVAIDPDGPGTITIGERLFEYHLVLDIPLNDNIDPASLDFVRCVTNSVNAAELAVVERYANAANYYSVGSSAIYSTLQTAITAALSVNDCGNISSGSMVPPNRAEVHPGNWQNPDPTVRSEADYGNWLGYFVNCLW